MGELEHRAARASSLSGGDRHDRLWHRQDRRPLISARLSLARTAAHVGEGARASTRRSGPQRTGPAAARKRGGRLRSSPNWSGGTPASRSAWVKTVPVNSITRARRGADLGGDRPHQPSPDNDRGNFFERVRQPRLENGNGSRLSGRPSAQHACARHCGTSKPFRQTETSYATPWLRESRRDRWPCAVTSLGPLADQRCDEVPPMTPSDATA
jgi:hypothetical protein